MRRAAFTIAAKLPPAGIISGIAEVRVVPGI
jgi:hypothetical protein